MFICCQSCFSEYGKLETSERRWTWVWTEPATQCAQHAESRKNVSRFGSRYNTGWSKQGTTCTYLGSHVNGSRIKICIAAVQRMSITTGFRDVGSGPARQARNSRCCKIPAPLRGPHGYFQSARKGLFRSVLWFMIKQLRLRKWYVFTIVRSVKEW